MSKKEQAYKGFEQGPIRPPSEADSLLIRVTRNCPWNRCTFCPVYKGSRFSLRPVDHVMQDIDLVHEHLGNLLQKAEAKGGLTREEVSALAQRVSPGDKPAFFAALNWYANGMESIFLQDANSLVMKPKDLIAVLKHIRKRFPFVKRITSYARSHTVSRISDEDLAEMAAAGLNRIHIGMESASDKVLEQVRKGSTKADHVKAGQKVKRAGIQLSEYVMPGLGGKELSEEHATETADALNQIDPDFIRLRSLAIPPNTPLFEEYQQGEFHPLKDVEAAEEILLFLESLSGIHSTVKSDHILNLFEEVEGKLPEDKQAMESVVRRFLDMDPERRTLYQVGRRIGVFRRLSDMENPFQADQAKQVMDKLSITPDNVDETIRTLMQRFV
ncbi:MAG: radical SAM protein [Deltaproteobacteria bacterium]|nr:radical SAM protein [Deltaproteobacteria bacterium]